MKNANKFFLILNSKELSLKAKGLYFFMHSKPKKYPFSYKNLSQELKENEKALRRVVKELEEFGVLVKKPRKDSNEKFTGWDWILDPTEEKKI